MLLQAKKVRPPQSNQTKNNNHNKEVDIDKLNINGDNRTNEIPE